MKRNLLATLITTATLGMSGTSLADTQTAALSELEALKQRVTELEQSPRQAESESHWSDRISVGGVAEFLATYSDTDGSGESDIDVDTVELTIDAQVNDFVLVSTTLKYEDDPEGSDDFFVDEAVAVIGTEDNPVSLILGKTGIPFAVLNGSTWSDPLTYDFTDNTDDVAILGFSSGSLGAEVYLFKGDQSNDDEVENFGANIALDLASGLSLGAGYLNNIGNIEPFAQSEDASAYRLNLAWAMGDLALFAEYIQADRFASLGGAKPAAAHIAIDYNTDVFGAPGMIAFGYSETDEASALDLAESRAALSISRELGGNAEVIVEYLREESYSGEETDALNLVLATSF